jgi:hypothetical protein
VPLARLKGVQRQLSAVESSLRQANETIEALNTQLSAAQQRAAQARRAEICATQPDIVPELVGGDTLDAVERSLELSRRAFAAAQQAYARRLPTPQVGSAAPSQPADPHANGPTGNAVQMIRQGLAQAKPDIND